MNARVGFVLGLALTLSASAALAQVRGPAAMPARPAKSAPAQTTQTAQAAAKDAPAKPSDNYDELYAKYLAAARALEPAAQSAASEDSERP